MQRLRVFDPEGESDPVRPKKVSVSVSDLAPLLADAWNSDRSWLRDFARDSVEVDNDLYQVLLAYQQYRRCESA